MLAANAADILLCGMAGVCARPEQKTAAMPGVSGPPEGEMELIATR